MPPRISILIIGWVASTLFVENLCSGGTQRRTSWSSPSKFDEACTCSQCGFSSDTPYAHCCFTQCQGLHSELKSALGVTDGNLDAHLRKLSSAGYLHSRMVLTERPETIYDLSPSGKRAFTDYLVALKAIIKITSTRTRLARR